MRVVKKFSRLQNCLSRTQKRLNGLSPVSMVKEACTTRGTVALSSFGTQAAVLLHMLSKVGPGTPVVMIDTGYLFDETYRYAEELSSLLELDLHVATSDMSAARMEALYGKLWENDDEDSHKLYGRLRKVDPANDMLQSLGARIVLSGLRTQQTSYRSSLKQIDFHEGRLKVFPLMKMNDQEIDAYIEEKGLPKHPLVNKGYVTVGDWHSSRPLISSERMSDARNTRFGGKFEECGLHVPESAHDLDKAVALLGATPQHVSGLTTHLVKKRIGESYCRKCLQVDDKISKQELSEYVGAVSVVEGAESNGALIARSFGRGRAPFFVIKEPGSSWSSVETLGEWKKIVKKYS